MLNGLDFDNDSVEGRIGNALHFDGRDDYINAVSVSLRASAFSISLWFNPDSTLDSESNREDYLYWSSAFGRPHLSFNKLGKGKIGLYVRVNGTNYDDVLTATSSWTASSWYHIVVTFDGTDFKIYVNGKLENTVNHSGKHLVASGAYFGSKLGQEFFFDGKLDDIRFYNYALAAGKVTALYESASKDKQKLR